MQFPGVRMAKCGVEVVMDGLLGSAGGPRWSDTRMNTNPPLEQRNHTSHWLETAWSRL